MWLTWPHPHFAWAPLAFTLPIAFWIAWRREDGNVELAGLLHRLCLSASLPGRPTHCLTALLPYMATISYCLTISLPHYLSASLLHCLTISLLHHLITSPPHCLIASLSDHLTAFVSVIRKAAEDLWHKDCNRWLHRRGINISYKRQEACVRQFAQIYADFYTKHRGHRKFQKGTDWMMTWGTGLVYFG